MPKFIDLSHEIPAEFSRAAQFKGYRSAIISWHKISETKAQETKLLLFSDQVSTHIDAPAHFNPNGKSIDQMPPELVFEVAAIVLDLSYKKKRENITPSDLEAAAEKDGVEIKQGDVPLIYTGASKLWRTPEYWRYVVPVTPDAVKWILDKGVKVFGVDEDEIDGDHLLWPSHMLMREREFYIIENLALWPAILELPKRFKFFGIPLAIDGATGSPVRAVAMLQENEGK